ncbi:eukaryotic translation initiation factor 5a [Anaeramoeba flamelloides]|uniref:Eukaryotic translation initiation factor 5A n=1 Tax=Anaeramoeba flamelloides TaxID=1746091 RepID=A0ABQ8Y5U3_9EUKA|nr:eukaryotic translation initiation factor 5a [Anaeramoeba flamelloides]KAJ6239655.1 eukaryotic translation initiation factor 5a [Anaeramoeba flamelloides]KAJ6239656.1 eukaryotic translation initiation factor 5a [Anaeramoeba flamelloides]KAJ6239659.1 eukaryotic translation initiation factor 5a [Anaeramoeba flamelloides]
MTSVPKQASAFRKGGHIILKDHVCKIVKMKTHKTGKHGHAKINFTGLDIFTNNKYEELQSATHSMQEPEVNKDEYDVIDIQEEFVSLANLEGESLELQIPKNEIGDNLRKGFEDEKIMIAIVTSAMGQTKITQFKEEK